MEAGFARQQAQAILNITGDGTGAIRRSDPWQFAFAAFLLVAIGWLATSTNGIEKRLAAVESKILQILHRIPDRRRLGHCGSNSFGLGRNGRISFAGKRSRRNPIELSRFLSSRCGNAIPYGRQ